MIFSIRPWTQYFDLKGQPPHEPDDAEWGEPFQYLYAPGKPIIGRMLARVPPWLVEEKPRPAQGRRTFVSFKFFTKDSPLLPSGLLGPVKLLAETPME